MSTHPASQPPQDLVRLFKLTGVDSTLLRNLVLALAFLKDASAVEQKGWVLPEAAQWPTLRRIERWDELLAALRAFDAEPANAGFDCAMAALQVEQLTAAGLTVAEITAALEQLPDGRSLETILNNSAPAAAEAGLRSLGDLPAALLRPARESTVCDLTCGEGATLVALLGYTQAPGQLYGVERSLATAAIARLRLALRGVPPENVRAGDVLPGDVLAGGAVAGGLPVQDGWPSRFAAVCACLPSAAAFNPAPGDGPGVSVSDAPASMLLQRAAGALAEGGRGVVVLGTPALVASGDKDARQRLVESGMVEAVIALPPELSVYRGAPAAVILLRGSPAGEAERSIRFVHAAGLNQAHTGRAPQLEGEQVERIAAAVQGNHDVRHFCTSAGLAAVAAQDYSLLPAAYLEFDNPTSFLGGNFPTRRLGEIAELLQGTRIERTEQGAGDTPVILARNLGEPNLALEDLELAAKLAVAGPVVHTATGDVLIQRLGATPVALRVEEPLQGAVVSHGIIAIRLRDEYAYLSRFLADYLNSARGQAGLTLLLEGDTVPVLTLAGLARLVVPLPDRYVTQLLEQLHGVERQLAERLATAQALRRRLFAIEDADTAGAEMLRLNTEARILADSVIATDDLGFRIRNFYPFLLAYGYRMLDAIPEPALRYPEQLRVAENLLAFLACAGLALADHLRKLPAVDANLLGPDVLRKYWQSGISPGDWQAIARQCGGLLRNTRETPAADSYGALWFKRSGSKASDFANDTRSLVGLKNDFKHDRGPKNAQDYANACTALQQVIDRCLAELAFLIQYPIRLVQNLDIDWRSNQAELQTLVYMGDHPGLRQEQVTFPRPLPEDHLYLEVGKGEWASLYPLISVQYCPSCRTHETYFVDVWDGTRGRIVIKSFERGHTLEDDAAQQVARDLEHWLAAAYEMPK